MKNENIQKFVLELRKGNLKNAKDSLTKALEEKYESKKNKINQEMEK